MRVTTGKSVLIENQFGQMNHDHLGKIITYASGLDASVVVWLVESARDGNVPSVKIKNKFFQKTLTRRKLDGIILSC